MFKFTLRLLLAAFVLGLAPSPAQAHTVLLKKARTAESVRCETMYTVKQYKSYASRVYRRQKVSEAAQRRMRAMHVCQSTFIQRKAVGKHHDRYKQARAYRRAVTALTPYPGPNGTRWAIPYYIVACESRGRWDAYNPSGASGPYQLLGWGAPMPANTPARKLAHHRIAARLWAGGRGASHWVCA